MLGKYKTLPSNGTETEVRTGANLWGVQDLYLLPHVVLLKLPEKFLLFRFKLAHEPINRTSS